LRLPYLIHPGLVQTAELGQLLSERLLDDLDPAPPAGAALRLRLPADWGVLRLHLPYDPARQPDPHRQIQWEVECNAPESAEQYEIDWKAEGGRTRVIAVRRNLVRFAQALASGLGLQLATLGVQDGEDPDGAEVLWLDIERAQDHRAALAREQYREPRPWGRVAAGIAILALAVWAGLLWLPRPAPESGESVNLPPRTPPAAVPSPATGTLPAPDGDGAVVEAAPGPAAADSAVLAPATPAGEVPAAAPPAAAAPAVAGRPGALLAAWRQLLTSLQAHEARLPEFLVIDAGGILVRMEGAGEIRLTEAVGRPSRVSRVDSGSYWLHFDQPLWPAEGGLLREDAGREARLLQAENLAVLAAGLEAAPQKLILQRLRDRGDGVGSGAWRFGGEPRGAALGWRVRLLPLAGPLGQPVDP
jgi:hypothetical protein